MAQNRLSDASSPYLQQHRSNPVHWQPWDEEAFELAKRGDKPIFLSVGYSSCHWCHVMEHESFEDAEIARILNDHFISIKVDREEKPDVDEIYMTAVQMSTGHGGWPMSVFLTPDKKPFFAGTYFPKEDRGSYPGFRSLLLGIRQAWQERKQELLSAADEFADALSRAQTSEPPPDVSSLDWSLIDSTISQIKGRLDGKNGGFEGKPKFPPHQAIQFLLHIAEMRGRKDCLAMATFTLDKMLMGGIHDHVGGGFHRYSTDEMWLLPHFEKMLYDNAQMLRNYANAFRLTQNEEYARVCTRLVGWLEREMTSPEGAFFSALDADSEGEEGKFYTWTLDEAKNAGVSEEFLRAFGFRKEGNFRDEATGEQTGANILHLQEPQDSQWDAELALLLQARESRPRPALDYKVLTAWNGLMISALATAGRRDAAETAARFFLQQGLPAHQYVNGKGEGVPFLDIAYFIGGLLDLSQATGEQKWKAEAASLFEAARQEFHDDKGGWFFTGTKHERHFGASKPAFDQATPSPNGVMVRSAIRLGHYELARRDLEALSGWITRAPLASESLLIALAMLLESSPGTAVRVPKLQVTAEPREAAVRRGIVTYALRLQIPSGFHINSARPGHSQLVATSVTVDGLSNESADIPGGPEPLSGELEVTVTGEPPQGREGEAKARVRYQLCSDKECLAPGETEVSLVWYRE